MTYENSMREAKGEEKRCHYALQEAKMHIGERIIASTEHTHVQKEALIAELKEMHRDFRSALVECGIDGVFDALNRWKGQVLADEFWVQFAEHVTRHPAPHNRRESSKTLLRGDAIALATEGTV